MASYEYLTQKQIEILLKCYYLKKYSKVAKVENITADKVLRIKENALQIISWHTASLICRGCDSMENPF